MKWSGFQKSSYQGLWGRVLLRFSSPCVFLKRSTCWFQPSFTTSSRCHHSEISSPSRLQPQHFQLRLHQMLMQWNPLNTIFFITSSRSVTVSRAFVGARPFFCECGDDYGYNFTTFPETATHHSSYPVLALSFLPPRLREQLAFVKWVGIQGF